MRVAGIVVCQKYRRAYMKSSGIGGQAVMEGIMMKHQDTYAVAVRKPNQEIELKKEIYHSIADRHPLCKKPFIRGIFQFVDSLRLGMSTLLYSSSFLEEEKTDNQKTCGPWMQKTAALFGKGEQAAAFAEQVAMTATVCVSVVLAVGIFMLLPVLLTNWLGMFIPSDALLAVIEGLIRIGIFVGYVSLISLMPEIHRTYMYHGAEHKCINCIEHGLPLTVEHVAESAKEHKRCGTSFMLLVMLISMFCFMIVRVDTLWLKLVVRVLMIPVIAGVSYEFLRLAGGSDHPLVNLFSKPGLWLQGLTTKEPDREMIEVAICAVEAVFDWRVYLQENFQTAEGSDAERNGL